MLSTNRTFHFIGKLNLKRSQLLKEGIQPKEDDVNWLFLTTGKRQLSFVYEIEEPESAKYGVPFVAKLAFSMTEGLDTNVISGQEYPIHRGQENVGTVQIIKRL